MVRDARSGCFFFVVVFVLRRLDDDEDSRAFLEVVAETRKARRFLSLSLSLFESERSNAWWINAIVLLCPRDVRCVTESEFAGAETFPFSLSLSLSVSFSFSFGLPLVNSRGLFFSASLCTQDALELFLSATTNEESSEMAARGLSGVSKLAKAECVRENRLAECLQKASQVPETFLVEHEACTWLEQLKCVATLLESKRNVPKVSEASVSIALGTCARGMYLAKKSATAKESGMVVSQAISSARRILDTVFVEAKKNDNEEALSVAEKTFQDLVTISRREEDGCLSGAIDCEYKHVRESTVATVASIELCNALVESHFDLFQKNEMLMRTLKERFCPIVEETLEKKFFCAAETTDFAQRRAVLQTLKSFVKVGRGGGFEKCIKTCLDRLVSSLESEMPAWLRASSLEILRFFCADGDICSFLHDAYYDPTKKDDSDTETPLGSICLIQARIVQSGLSMNSSEPTTSSWKPQGVVYDAVQKEFEKKMQKLSIAMKKKTKKNNTTGEEYVDNEEHDHDEIVDLENTDAHITRAVTIAIEGLLNTAQTIERVAYSVESPKRLQTAKKMLDAVWETLASMFSLTLDFAENDDTCLYIFEAYQNAGRASVKCKHKLAREAFLGTLCHFAVKMPKKQFNDNGNVVRKLSVKNALSLRAIFNIVDASKGHLEDSWFMVLETIASLERTLGVAEKTLKSRAREYVPIGLKPSNWTNTEYEYKEEYYVFSEAAQDMFNAMNSYDDDDLVHVVDALIKANIGELREARTLREKQSLSSAKKKANKPITYVRLRNLERLRVVMEVNASRRFALFWDTCAKHFLNTILEEGGNSREQAHEIYEKIVVNVLETDLDLDGKNVAYAKSVGFETVDCCVVTHVQTMYDGAVDYRGKQLALSLVHALVCKRRNKLKTSWPIIFKTLSKLAENEGDADLTIESFVTMKVIENECVPFIGREYYRELSECFSSYAHQKNEINVALSAVTSLSTIAELFGDFCHRPENAADVPSWSSTKMTPSRNGVKLNLLTKNGLADFSISPVFFHLCERFDDIRLEVRDCAVQTFATLFVSRASLLSKNELKDCAQKVVFPAIDKCRKVAKTASMNDPDGLKIEWNFSFVNMHASIYGNMLKNALPLLITVENFDKNFDELCSFFVDSVLSDCEELGTAALNNFLPLLLEHDESTTKGMPRPLWKKAMKALHVATEKATLPPSVSPQKTRVGIATLFGSLYDGKSDSFDDADCRGAILALQQLIKSPCVAGDAQPVDGVQWDAQKRALKSIRYMCAKSKEGKTRTLMCTESFNVLLKESTSFAERQWTQTPADLAFAKAGMKAFYEMYDAVANDEVRAETYGIAMTAIAKISRRWNATQTQRISEQDENYDEAEYIEQLKNWNAVLMQKTALQALVVVSRRGVASLNLPTISSNSDISSKAVAKSDWSATADAFETVLGQNVEIMSSNDDNDDDQEAMLDEDEKEGQQSETSTSVSEQAKKAKTFSDLTIASATALGEVVLRYSVTAEDGCILRFLRSLARGCAAPRIDVALESYAQLCDLTRFASYRDDQKKNEEGAFTHRARVARLGFPRVIACTKNFLEEHANAPLDTWTYDTTRDALNMCSTLAVSKDFVHSQNKVLNGMLEKARESKDEVKDEELVLGVFVYEALSKAVAAAVVDDIQKLGMFALLGAGKYLGIVM